MHLLVAAALLAALFSLVFGLLLSASWLIVVSILASAVALFGAMRTRADPGAGRGGAGAPVVPAASADGDVGAPDDERADDDAGSAPDEPDGPDERDERDEPGADAGDEQPVWVVDGRPRYHLARCSFLKGKAAESIALAQAAEDGFTPCSLCRPPRRAR